MDWAEARERTLRKWRQILDGLDGRDVLALVSEINDVSELCDLSGSAADAGSDRCRGCIVFGDPRRCAEARWRISESLLEGELDEARAAMMAIVAQIAAARPPESVRSGGVQRA